MNKQFTTQNAEALYIMAALVRVNRRIERFNLKAKADRTPNFAKVRKALQNSRRAVFFPTWLYITNKLST